MRGWTIVSRWRARGRPSAPGRDATAAGGENPGLVTEQHFTDVLRESTADLPRSPDFLPRALHLYRRDVLFQLVYGALAARGSLPPSRRVALEARCPGKQHRQPFSPPVLGASLNNSLRKIPDEFIGARRTRTTSHHTPISLSEFISHQQSRASIEKLKKKKNQRTLHSNFKALEKSRYLLLFFFIFLSL